MGFIINKKNLKINQKNKIQNFYKIEHDRLLHFSKLSAQSSLKELDSAINGLSLEKVQQLQDKVGLNSISDKKKSNLFFTIFSALVNPFSLILMVISVLIVVVPLLKNEDQGIQKDDWISFFIILSMLLISTFIRIFQESRSSKASQKLQEMIKTTTAIKRNNLIREMPIDEVVPGDIIKLSAGDMIPADMRIISAKDLFVTQSSLTGESEPTEKFENDTELEKGSIFDIKNLCFMGTSVSSGSALGVVINTGKSTYFGKIAKSLSKKSSKSNFDKGISYVSWLLIWTMLVMSLVIFVIVGFKRFFDNTQVQWAIPWLNALNFSLAVAIGITPEMLPMIVTINLAKQAYRLSKQKTIVKKINSIQSFGAMEVLCTDKTGTLTEDRIILERHINLEGKDDSTVLQYAFLNSYYQTGLKNMLDLAVIKKAEELDIDDPVLGFEKIDEIPFDFQRKRMSVIVVNKQKKQQLITKGAYEEIMNLCNYAKYKGKIVEINKAIRDKASNIVKQLNSDGMRVIAIAINYENLPKRNFQIKDENNLILIGFIALLDPPKKTAYSAINALQKNGIKVKVLTGDNEVVTKYVCSKVGIDSSNILLGSDISKMSDSELKTKVMKVNVFAKLSPEQKQRIVLAIKENNRVVGFMGDGINDAPAMKAADIGISVDTAVDIAKESADIILLEKDLRILEKGVIEGRKAFCNIIKYIKMSVSSSFGNMLSMLIGSCWLPFEPMITTHILVLNMIYDFSQSSIPWDNVDAEYFTKPRQWDPKSIFRFMIFIGPISTIFDIISFLIMFYVFCWNGEHGNVDCELFSTGWFFISLLTQSAIIYVLRTEKIPFIQSNPSLPVNLSIICILLVGFLFVSVDSMKAIKFHSLFVEQPLWLLYGFLLTLGYIFFCQLSKKYFIKVFNEWL